MFLKLVLGCTTQLLSLSMEKIVGFGDNERAQLGHETLRTCLEPTKISFHEMTDDTNVVSDSE